MPALSLSPYDTPTPLPGEANLEALRMRVTHVTRGKRQTRGKVQGCCVHPCFTAPLVRSLLAPEQPYNNNDTFDKHRDMTTRWLLTYVRRAAHALVALKSAFRHVRVVQLVVVYKQLVDEEEVDDDDWFSAPPPPTPLTYLRTHALFACTQTHLY